MKLNQHTGFKRLSILIAAIAFVIMMIAFIAHGINASHFIEAFIISAFISAGTFALIRIIYWVVDWIVDGFISEKIKNNDQDSPKNGKIDNTASQEFDRKIERLSKIFFSSEEIQELQQDLVFSKEILEYKKLGFNLIPRKFFKSETRKKAERLYQEGLTEKIGGFAFQKMRMSAELGHLEAINYLRKSGVSVRASTGTTTIDVI